MDPRAPRCFLHIPKCGGISVHEAIAKAWGADAIAPRRMDTSAFADFEDFELLGDAVRTSLMLDEAELSELANYPIVSGHFFRSTLLRISEPSRIATLLREPRSRLLSLYLFWRMAPGIRQLFQPYRPMKYADGPLDGFLSEPKIARSTDNVATRMLLAPDERIPDRAFIRPSDVAAVASDAILALDELGCAAVLELDTLWEELSNTFGVQLEPAHENITGMAPASEGSLPAPDTITHRALALLEERTAADAVVYRHAVAQHGLSTEATESLAERAFARRLAGAEMALVSGR